MRSSLPLESERSPSARRDAANELPALPLEAVDQELAAINADIERMRAPLAKRLQRVLDALEGRVLEPPSANVQIVQQINAVRTALRLTLRLKQSDALVQLRCGAGSRQKNPTIQVVRSAPGRKTEYAAGIFPALQVGLAE